MVFHPCRRGAAERGLSTVSLERAYRHCAEVTRRSGSSFSAAFWLLSAERRRAIHAIYAFCRLADDIADDPAIEGDRRRLLEAWRRELELAYLQKSEHLVGIALGDTIQRFRLPEQVFLDLLRGVESDVNAEPIQTFDDLRLYCYRVASTVGLLVVRVLGASDSRSTEYAEMLGIAVQLTNVLRDIGEDAAEGRIYLPAEDLARFGVEPEQIFAREKSDSLRLLLAFSAERARIHYEGAALALPESERRVLRPAEAMGKIYRALLEKIYREGFPCFGAPLKLSKVRRIGIAASVWLWGNRP